MSDSPYLAMKRLETALNSVLSRLDVAELPAEQQKLVRSLKSEAIDARLDIQDYELSETRADQLRKAKDGKARLAKIRAEILKGSEYGLFGAIDVAQLSAEIEQISDALI